MRRSGAILGGWTNRSAPPRTTLESLKPLMATILTSPDGPLVTVVTVREETPDLDGTPVTIVRVHRLQSCRLVRLQRLLTLVQVVPDVRAGPFETGNREGRNRQNTPIGPGCRSVISP